MGCENGNPFVMKYAEILCLRVIHKEKVCTRTRHEYSSLITTLSMAL